MAADMDIEMDLDIGLEDMAIPGPELVLDYEFSSDAQFATKPVLSTPNDTSENNAFDLLPEKVHLHGLDNLTTNDIKAFALEYFPSDTPSRVEWIDDTSANLVYDTPDIAAAALASFAATPISDVTQIPTLQAIAAKAFPAHPETTLEVRLAVNGDRKQPGARERSRFYLLNPKYDPAERRKNGGHRAERTYRDRDDGGYRSQKYDDNEQRKRERDTEFDASLYDDDEDTREKRARRNSHRRKPPLRNDSRGISQGVRYDGPSGKELFPDRSRRGSGRLRDRSASPLRDGDGDGDRDVRELERNKRQDDAARANRLKAQAIKAKLGDRSAGVVKELFPQKTGHRRSSAFDAADETADLFANRMPVPFMDGGNDKMEPETQVSGFRIRGAAKAGPTQSFSIKGAARVKELFPNTLGDNSGKELFAERLEGRGRRRQRAEDLFY